MTMPPDRLDYRKLLVEADERSQENFDKTVIALSGGGMGVSLAFVDNIVGDRPLAASCLLLLAWAAWTASLLVVLTSFYLSRLALRQAIAELDAGVTSTARPGGRYAVLTTVANFVGPALFIIGAILMGVFVFLNIGGGR